MFMRVAPIRDNLKVNKYFESYLYEIIVKSLFAEDNINFKGPKEQVTYIKQRRFVLSFQF